MHTRSDNVVHTYEQPTMAGPQLRAGESVANANHHQYQWPNDHYQHAVGQNTVPLISQPMANTSATSNYHPATTPHPNQYSDDPLGLRAAPIGPIGGAALPPLGGLRPNHMSTQQMNAYQAQQFLGKMLTNWKYEGYKNDNSKYVSLEEFISLIRQYQLSTACAERGVLSHMATFMTGAAFTWWKTNSHTVYTIDEMESRLRIRFERQSNDPISVLLEFASRKQGKEEDLLDYIDDLRQKLARYLQFLLDDLY